jgi:hypothetical protein
VTADDTRQAEGSPEDEPQPDAPIQAGPFRCATHHQVETYLRCGRCEKPICPRCLIQTPVGARCRECARLRRPPMYEVSWINYLRGTIAALVTGFALGVLAVILESRLPFGGLLVILLMAGVGYVVGAATSWAARRKRGLWLGLIAAASVPIGLLLARAALFAWGGADWILALGFAVATSFLPIWGLIGIAVGAFVAYTRLR